MVSAQLGNYRVGDLLGEGGMGVVYRGHHEVLGHPVAIKVLRSELTSDASMVKRFFHEAQAATAIRNPGIVHIYDFGTSPDGATYFVMELLDGVSLSAHLAQRRLDLVECCRLGRQIANVLQAAHARGIVHRDLKPDNLFLVPDPEVAGGERVKVLDFGIAKLVTDAQSTSPRTRTGLTLGTPRYMSPEQCRGAGTVDARSDIYSLGCVLFEMVCGRPPFEAEGAGAVIGAHQFLEPPRPEGIASGIPPALSALILNMLAKDPAARPQTMAEVGQVLEEIQRRLAEPVRSAEPVPQPPPQRPETQGAWPPTPATPPSATTLGASAGTLRSAPARRHSPAVIVVVATVVSSVLLAIALRASGSGAEPRSAVVQMPAPAAAGGAVDAGVALDAASASAAAAPVPPSAPAPPPPEPTPTAVDAVELACLHYQSEGKWADLDACADRLKQYKPQLARELKDRAILEERAAPRIRAFEDAMKDGDLRKARAELDAIPETVSGHGKAKAQYAAAEQAAIRDLAARLEDVKAGDCREYNQLLAQERAAKPSRIAGEAARLVRCVPPAARSTACNFDELIEKGRALFTEGRNAAALAAYEQAIACRPDQTAIQRAFIVACNMRATSKARTMWKLMTPRSRSAAAGVCVRNGVTESELSN